MEKANTPSITKPKLLDQVRDKIRLKHYCIRTEEAYVNWIKRFILFRHKRHPVEMGAAEVDAFLTHLAGGGQGGGFDAEPGQGGASVPLSRGVGNHKNAVIPAGIDGQIGRHHAH